MPLSFSRLSTFEQCPAKFDYLYNSRTVQDSSNAHTEYGTRVHLGLELYGRGLCGDAAAEAEFAALGNRSEFEPFLPLVDKIVARPGQKLFEHEMALSVAKTPCDWRAPDVWIRGIADVLIVDGAKAWCGDYKTGKVKDNPTQLQVFSLLTMLHFPEVEEVKTSFIWLSHNDISTTTYKRRTLPHLWLALEPRFKAVQDAVDLGVFKAKPSGLCPWCPAKDLCPQARRR